MNTKLLLKATLITLLMPGSVIGLIPYYILRGASATDTVDFSLASAVAALSGLIGVTVLLYSIWGFAVHGQGTLAPIDPPRVLVVRGLYRFTRNPMYLAVVLVLVSEALLFRSISLLLYAAFVLVCFHLFVTVYEEPHLRSRFGKSYEDYLNAVPRWQITLRPYGVQKER